VTEQTKVFLQVEQKQRLPMFPSRTNHSGPIHKASGRKEETVQVTGEE